MLDTLLILLLRGAVGARPRWIGCQPLPHARIYFPNHSSHLDAPVLWASLHGHLRRLTRPVAAKDYWGKPGPRRWLADSALRALLIDRERTTPDVDPLAPLSQALAHGESLILFPEGTRGGERLPAAFRSGLYRLAMRHSDVELIPVYLENLYRSMPKGAQLPAPCDLAPPLIRVPRETKASFLERARAAVVALA